MSVVKDHQQLLRLVESENYGGHHTSPTGSTFWGMCKHEMYKVSEELGKSKDFNLALYAVCASNAKVAATKITLTDIEGNRFMVFFNSPLYANPDFFGRCISRHTHIFDGEDVNIRFVTFKFYVSYEMVHKVVANQSTTEVFRILTEVPVSTAAVEQAAQVKVWCPNEEDCITVTDFFRGLMVGGLQNDLKTFLEYCPEMTEYLTNIFSYSSSRPGFNEKTFLYAKEWAWIFDDCRLEGYHLSLINIYGYRFKARIFSNNTLNLQANIEPEKLPLSIICKIKDPQVLLTEPFSPAGIPKRFQVVIDRKTSFNFTLIMCVMKLKIWKDRAKRAYWRQVHEEVVPDGSTALQLRLLHDRTSFEVPIANASRLELALKDALRGKRSRNLRASVDSARKARLGHTMSFH